MTDEMAGKTVWRVEVADETATAALAADIAALLKNGDTVTLAGDLGAGKTTFARALIRKLLDDPAIEAPSPTFTLMQIYEGETARIVHADFYRIGSASELSGLGWEEAVEDAIVLAEWAERAPEVLPPDRLDVRLSFADADNRDARRVTISGYGAFAARLKSFKSLRELLRREGWADATRSFLLGDASSRAYETLVKPDGQRAILMISPPRPDGPPIRYGKSYSAIAHLAENVKPFVAVAHGLLAHGLSAPEIYGQDLDAGLLIVEDLGREGVVDENGPISERYLEAAAALAHLHSQRLPEALPIDGAGNYHIPPYDLDALLIEVDLLLEWYVPHRKAAVASGARAVFSNLWRQALLEVASAPPTWTLRDYHSPNLIWLESRQGVRRIGVIDFQDCVLGHPAYDMASLGQDARVAVPDDLELKLLAHYAKLRKDADESFDMAAFAKAYMTLAAQRATKVLGIFARLDQRDGKPQYLAHMPRVEAYLKKSLRHPALAEIKAWYESNLPGLFNAP
ncbi:bifunctional tRNA (adenosine(37)-N6)-threonylcarbamoyltransferase complex ATPase subunit type 1 TsaE/phosphotransferase [Methylocystis parvus]|uniref:tRNA threonylcarbamoyladenosine biosynthesis protein TsaE n=1 Tax=Methylocystis parvus TaxID=134 RepID=A0A6B8M1L3_9HYPH|nr:bifunctional tRNA (adenosine(37)-N6)-threonylcarbamoyltransferase complex ATPase subunit type 1 TsaE/phosphotransferase [Methylocystis parvus]QGM96146.1 bifunctional tRNA (adenosine(37)-N6)-threonylcarbamoyltransferase complex ATPase subunit type 1 TsaE/phosphotransferase [Methylocystis parvus]WBK00032.1 bifunctional tRNA (adenosine(37)-N6)-threonylcarbamoyltransferase complex ATPase subunit type 1 TsaE/phosphotransferase [Methylocystis parvus OBBP]